MIKLTYCLHRRPEFTREAFQDYWRNRHGPLVAKHREVLKIKRYVQLHSRDLEYADAVRASRAGSPDAAPEIYDGVAQLWWESLDDLVVTATDEKAATAGAELLEDEAKFIDFARSPLWMGEEVEIFG